MGVRIYQVAKELGLESKALIDKCKELGIKVTSHMSSLEPSDVERLKGALARPAAREAPAVPKARRPRAEAPKAKEDKKAVAKEVTPPAAVKEKPAPVEEAPRRRIELPPADAGYPRARLGRGPVRRPRFRRKEWRRERPAFVGPITKSTELEEPITVKVLSSKLGLKASDIIKRLMQVGHMVNITQSLTSEQVSAVAQSYGVEIKVKTHADYEGELMAAHFERREENLVPRAPVVTLLGHVDHGKTSLLDSIRKSNLVSKETGGITQHIGAYKVRSDGKSVVFLDTPGHEAFTAMRARGANVTDVVVLVVAADDGVMPQTEEAIAHARAANVPIVVAVNKVDKPDANALRAMQQLSEHGLVPEAWGGKTVFVETSAVTNKGLNDLVEMLSLEAELLELRSDPTKPASGTVLEAKMLPGRGIVAHVLVRDGTLHQGDVILCGEGYGKVRDIIDDRGASLTEAGASTPAEISGLSALPEAGDHFYAVQDVQKAKEVALNRQRRRREASLAHRRHVTLEDLFSRVEAGAVKELRMILKADVKGSAEVVLKSLQDLSTGEVKVGILHVGVGAINQSDVLLADASDAIVVGFNVVPEERARRSAAAVGVEIRTYQIIYEIINDIRAALEGMLKPESVEVTEGRLTVKQIFKISRIGTIAGCGVDSGQVRRQSRVRVVRNGAVIYDGVLASLKHFKDDVREVRQGMECGIKVENYDDVKEGDEIIAYRIDQVARKLAS